MLARVSRAAGCAALGWIVSACSTATHGAGGPLDRQAVLIPTLAVEAGVPWERGREVASRLRVLVRDMPTHTAVPGEELELARQRYKVEVMDALTTRQLAQLMGAKLAAWGIIAPAPRGGLRADVQFVEPRSGDRIDLQGVTGSNAGALAKNIFALFRQRVEGLRQLSACNEHIANDRFEQALVLCDSALIVLPRSSAAHFARATAFRETERYPEALDAYRRGLELNPGSLEAVLGAGLVASHLGRPAEAMAAYGEYLDLSRGSERVRITIANEVAKTGDFLSTFRLLAPVADADLGEHTVEFQRFLFAVATAAGQKVREEGDSAAARPYFETALSAFARGYASDTATVDPTTLRQVVALNGALGRGEEALRLATVATERHPGVAAVWWQYATSLTQAGRHADALRALDRVVELDPAYDGVYLRRGTVGLALGRREQALADLDRAAAAGAREGVGALLLRRGVEELREDRFAEASELLERARGYAAPAAQSDLAFFWGYALYKQGESAARAGEGTAAARARRALPFFQRALPLLRESSHANAEQAATAAQRYIQNQQAVLGGGR